MKQLFFIGMFCLSVTNLLAQKKSGTTDSVAFDGYTKKVETQRQSLEHQKKYAVAISLMNEWMGLYSALPISLKQDFKHTEASMYYNLACYYALSGQKDGALNAFEKAEQSGFSNYSLAAHDSDLQSLHEEKRYLTALQAIREHWDFAYILRSSGAYNEKVDDSFPKITYQNADAAALVEFKNKFKLDSVAGNGDELSKIKSLLLWVHNVVKYDGSSDNPLNKNGADLIEICKKENRGVNCRMMATILKDVYLAEGFQARAVTCMPKDSADVDCHVIDVVWSKTLNKWVWMDAAMYAYITDKHGNLQSIQEVRDKLYHDQGDQLVLNDDANMNNENKNSQSWYLGYYMPKNLYWLQCTASNEWDLETVKTGKPKVTYISLYPEGFKSTKNQNAIADVAKSKYATNNADAFWQKPN